MEQESKTNQSDEDYKAYWKLGIFYFNPKDKRIFPPKRMKGLAWTINFANPWSVIAGLLLVAAVMYISQWLKTL